jgi:UPF0716 family protein affecting phage T7 exclusion
MAAGRPALRAQGVETSDARQNHTQPNRSPERTLTVSTSLKIAAATLLALFASCLTTTSAQAQHRSNRISGIVRDVFDVIADELEDYEEDYEDEYDDYEEDYEDEFDYEQNERSQDRFPSIERGPNQSTLNRLPPGFIGQWRVLTPPGMAGAPRVEYSFRSNGATTRITTGNYYRARPVTEVLRLSRWSQGELNLNGQWYMARFQGNQLILTNDRGSVTRLERVD